MVSENSHLVCHVTWNDLVIMSLREAGYGTSNEPVDTDDWLKVTVQWQFNDGDLYALGQAFRAYLKVISTYTFLLAVDYSKTDLKVKMAPGHLSTWWTYVVVSRFYRRPYLLSPGDQVFWLRVCNNCIPGHQGKVRKGVGKNVRQQRE